MAIPATVSYYYPGGGIPVCQSNDGCRTPRCTDDGCAGSNQTTVTGPNATWLRYTFGNSYRYNEGKLLKVEQGSSASSILRTTTTTYQLALSGQPYANPIGTTPQLRGDSFTAEYLRPRISQVIAQDGASFTSAVDTGCTGSGIHCFDAFARATRVKKFSSVGSSKTEGTAYHDTLADWVLGQPAKQTVNGIVAAETGYDALARPTWTKSFGKRQQTLSYNADGTLASVKDGNNNVTTLSSWYRGVPRVIQHPPTPEAPTGATESAVVDGNGWITSVTDETRQQDLLRL